MKRRVTIKDVAKAARVHASTVSRALDPNSKHPLSQDVIQRVRKIAKRLGFKANAAGYSLKTRRSRLVGVIVPDITDPAIPPIIRGLEAGLERHGYAALLANTDSDRKREAELVEIMTARGVDGLALASVVYHDRLLKSPSLQQLPIVTVARQTDNPKISCVLHDENGGFRELLAHLVSFGHRAIASIAGPQDLSTGRNRHLAVRDYAAQTKIKIAPTIFARAFNEQEGQRCMEELLAERTKFTAVVCANDRLAIGAIAALKQHGRRCPQDVSVTGFNDMPMVERIEPALTTVRVQHYRAGFDAAEMLVEQMQQEARKRVAHQIRLPVELVVRESTRRI
jgi:LacI family transcriptional regulator